MRPSDFLVTLFQYSELMLFYYLNDKISQLYPCNRFNKYILPNFFQKTKYSGNSLNIFPCTIPLSSFSDIFKYSWCNSAFLGFTCLFVLSICGNVCHVFKIYTNVTCILLQLLFILSVLLRFIYIDTCPSSSLIIPAALYFIE